MFFISFFTSKCQEKNINMQEELIDAFETIKYYIEKEGDLFNSDTKDFGFEGKQITHTIGTNTITIQNHYPTTTEGLQGDVNLINYSIKKDSHNQITFWKDDVFIKQSDKTYTKKVLDVYATYNELRHYTFDHFYLTSNITNSFNGLDMTILSTEKNNDLKVKIVMKYKNKTDSLVFSRETPIIYFEGFFIDWRYAGLQQKDDGTHFRVSKKHKLPVWNYFIESTFNPNIEKAAKKIKAINKVASKWGIPINVQFTVVSLSHDLRIEKNKIEPILKQQKKTFVIYENHFGKEWKKNFDKEVEKMCLSQ